MEPLCDCHFFAIRSLRGRCVFVMVVLADLSIIARPVESRPTEKVDFRSVPYYRPVFPSLVSLLKLPKTFDSYTIA